MFWCLCEWKFYVTVISDCSFWKKNFQDKKTIHLSLYVTLFFEMDQLFLCLFFNTSSKTISLTYFSSTTIIFQRCWHLQFFLQFHSAREIWLPKFIHFVERTKLIFHIQDKFHLKKNHQQVKCYFVCSGNRAFCQYQRNQIAGMMRFFC